LATEHQIKLLLETHTEARTLVLTEVLGHRFPCEFKRRVELVINEHFETARLVPMLVNPDGRKSPVHFSCQPFDRNLRLIVLNNSQ